MQVCLNGCGRGQKVTDRADALDALFHLYMYYLLNSSTMCSQSTLGEFFGWLQFVKDRILSPCRNVLKFVIFIAVQYHRNRQENMNDKKLKIFCLTPTTNEGQLPIKAGLKELFLKQKDAWAFDLSEICTSSICCTDDS